MVIAAQVSLDASNSTSNQSVRNSNSFSNMATSKVSK